MDNNRPDPNKKFISPLIAAVLLGLLLVWARDQAYLTTPMMLLIGIPAIIVLLIISYLELPHNKKGMKQ